MEDKLHIKQLIFLRRNYCPILLIYMFFFMWLRKPKMTSEYTLPKTNIAPENRSTNCQNFLKKALKATLPCTNTKENPRVPSLTMPISAKESPCSSQKIYCKKSRRGEYSSSPAGHVRKRTKCKLTNPSKNCQECQESALSQTASLEAHPRWCGRASIDHASWSLKWRLLDNAVFW